MAKKPTDAAKGKKTGTVSRGKQPPPPAVESIPPENETVLENDKGESRGKKKYIEFDAAEAIYKQLVMTRKVLDELVDEAKEAKIKKQLDQLPVSVSDLMQGFQAAMSKANKAVQAGEEGGEDIEQMSIKNLEVSIDAPIINENPAHDPMIMLPNENSSDSSRAKVTMKFSVVSVPKVKR